MPSLIKSGLDQFNKIKNWENSAHGVWVSKVGDIAKTTKYTDLAASPPKITALNERQEVPFPFSENPILASVSDDHKVAVRIPVSPDEKIYGFGLQLDGIRHTKKVMTLIADHWKQGGGRTHAPVPFFISNKGYGVFFNTACYLKCYVQIGNRKDSPNNPVPVDRNPPPEETTSQSWTALPAADAVEADAHTPGLEIVVFGGTSLLDIVSRYNLYAGGGALPPIWGLGFWHRLHARDDAGKVEAAVDAFKNQNFPLDVLGFEPGWMKKSYPCAYEWQTLRFPDPEALTQKLLKDGIRLNLWINPYISPESSIYDEMYPYSGSHLVWLGLVPDYYLPDAAKCLCEHFQELHIKPGISGYKIDEVDGFDKWLWPDHATFPSGQSGETMRQSYGQLMQKTIHDGLFRKNNQRTYGNVRASNGAASGYPFVLYSDSYDHLEYLTGISAASLSGVLWTPEVRNAEDERDWLNRMQTVAFSHLAMLDAWASGLLPWSFTEVTEAVREVIHLRLRLLPYLYSAFAEYCFKGEPPLRAMLLEGASDHTENIVKGTLDSEKNPYEMDMVIEKNDQFMFGPSILVAPFYDKCPIEREVSLPPGVWYDFYTGGKVSGGRVITVTASDLKNRIPLFVKDNSLIPMLDANINRTEQAYGMNLEVRYYGSGFAECDLYEDDGQSFNYENGEYRLRRLQVSDGKLIESIVTDNGPAMYGECDLVTMTHQGMSTQS